MMWPVLLHGLALPAAAGQLAFPAAASQLALASPGAWVVALLRWLLFAGLSGALGGLAGRGLSRQYKGAAAGPLPAPWALRSSLLGLIAAAGLAVAAAGDGSLAAGLAHPLAHRLSSSTSGVIAIIEVAGFAAAAALLRLRLAGARGGVLIRRASSRWAAPCSPTRTCCPRRSGRGCCCTCSVPRSAGDRIRRPCGG